MKTTKFSQGMLQVYTGDGKGKTTAALGLAFRAVGHGLRVCVIQFLKNPDMMGTPYGELTAAKKLAPNLTIHSFGLPKWISKNGFTDEDKAEVVKAVAFAKKQMAAPDVNVVILDEGFLPLHFGIISLKELTDLIDARPKDKELILTGRKAPPEIIALADLVTEARQIKHYFEKGVNARSGIEY
jgi:cob(I)alamin adenosyltransferase